MSEWIASGAELAWLIDPEAQTVEIYRPNLPVDVLADATQVIAGTPVEGFTLELSRIWNPLG